MIRSQLRHIEARRARLSTLAAAERAILGGYCERVAVVSTWFRDRSLVFGGMETALAVALGPKRLLGFATSAWSLWKIYSGIRKIRL